MSFSPQASTEPQDALDVRSYLAPIWRRKWVIIAIVCVAGAATYFISSSMKNQYASSTNVYVQVAYPTLNTVSSATAAPQPPTADELNDVAQLVTSAQVKTAVANRLGKPVAEVGSVSATASSSSDFVTITATSGSPTTSAQIANLFASEYLKTRRASLTAQANSAIQAARKTLASLPTSVTNLAAQTERQAITSEIQAYEQTILDPQVGAYQTTPAVAPATASSPRPKEDTIFGVGAGLLFGIAFAFALELLDTRVATADDLERVYQRAALAALPRVRDAAPFSEGLAVVPPVFVESLRMLRFLLRLNPDGPEHKIILITSGLQSEGKSTLVRNLALVYADAGQRTLVIDADLRKQSIAGLFGISPTLGLLDVMARDVSLKQAVEPVVTGVPGAGEEPSARGGLDVLVAGEATRNVNLLASSKMRELLLEAAANYDIVLIDTAPLLIVADSTPLLTIADSVIVVGRLGVVTAQRARKLVEILQRVGGVHFAGVVANGADSGSKDNYGYGYGYGIDAQEPGIRPAARTSEPAQAPTRGESAAESS